MDDEDATPLHEGPYDDEDRLFVSRFEYRIDEAIASAASVNAPQPTGWMNLEEVAALEKASKLHEFVARAALIVGWVAFEDIVSECLGLVYWKHPKLLLGALTRRAGEERLHLDTAKRLLLGEPLVKMRVALADEEVSRVVSGNDELEKIEACFKRLGVTLPGAKLESIERVRAQRNKAAHEEEFKPPDDMPDLMAAFRDATAELVTSCAEKHNVSVI